MRVKPRGRIVVGVVVVLVIVLGVVVFVRGQGTMTAREHRDGVVEFVMNSTDKVDVTGWRPRTSAWAQECSLGWGAEGAHFGYDLWAPEGTDREGDARRVAAYWESLGMTVRITDTTAYPTVYGQGGPVLRADFDTGAVENSYRLGATAPCAPGDAYELNGEDEAARAAGEVLLGDEGVIPTPDSRELWKSPTPTPEPARVTPWSG